MVSSSLIMGRIEGIGRRDYDLLADELKRFFQRVRWQDEALVIRSEQRHAKMRPVFQMIADRMVEGRFGSLLYVGSGNVACFYFAHGRVTGRRYREPEPPDWWRPR